MTEKAINKSDLIKKMAENRQDMNELVVDVAVRELLDLMVCKLVADGRIEVRGFGSFSLHHRKPRLGRNPKTGEPVKVAAKAIPHFKPGKALRDNINASV